MRIAWITSGFSADENDYRGAGAIHNLAKDLSLYPGIKLDIYSLYYPKNKPEYKFYNATVFSFGTGKENNKLSKLFIWKSLLRKFKQEHLKDKYVLIHSIWSNEPGYLASKLSIKYNIPLVTNICGGELADLKAIKHGSRLKYYQKKMVDRTLQGAIKIVSGCDFISDKINDYYGSDIYKKVTKIPFGADNDLFKAHDKKEKKGMSLINIANAVPVKDHLTLFKAVKVVRLKYPEVVINCYGRNLKKIYADYINPQYFKLNDFVEYSEIPKVLNQNDIFVLSSLYESQNLSVIEAAFCGLPVVSTDVGVAREVTSNLVKPGNYQALAGKIIYVIENYDKEKNKILNVRNELISKFSCESVIKQFVELYRDTI
jgi:glycosyltransferase involved in cell wall biosynthesis